MSSSLVEVPFSAFVLLLATRWPPAPANTAYRSYSTSAVRPTVFDAGSSSGVSAFRCDKRMSNGDAFLITLVSLSCASCERLWMCDDTTGCSAHSSTCVEHVLLSTPSCSSSSARKRDERRRGCGAMRFSSFDVCGRSSVNATDCGYCCCDYLGSSDARSNHDMPDAACSPRARNGDAATTCTTLACGSVAYAS